MGVPCSQKLLAVATPMLHHPAREGDAMVKGFGGTLRDAGRSEPICLAGGALLARCPDEDDASASCFVFRVQKGGAIGAWDRR